MNYTRNKKFFKPATSEKTWGIVIVIAIIIAKAINPIVGILLFAAFAAFQFTGRVNFYDIRTDCNEAV